MKPIRFLQHARAEAVRREIPADIVEQVMRGLEQVVPEHGGLSARQ
ncbi:MAG: hypothetical protein ABIL25_10145 [candidate division WOR-3 bacterium]